MRIFENCDVFLQYTSSMKMMQFCFPCMFKCHFAKDSSWARVLGTWCYLTRFAIKLHLHFPIVSMRQQIEQAPTLR